MQTENRKEFDLDRILHPAGAYRTPMEVVNDPDMTVQEKRAILASWASDACAVEAAPDLRQPPTVPPARFDDIMDALKRLDGEATDNPTYGKFISRARRWKDLYRNNRGRQSPFGDSGRNHLCTAQNGLEPDVMRRPGMRRLLAH